MAHLMQMAPRAEWESRSRRVDIDAAVRATLLNLPSGVLEYSTRMDDPQSGRLGRQMTLLLCIGDRCWINRCTRQWYRCVQHMACMNHMHLTTISTDVHVQMDEVQEGAILAGTCQAQRGQAVPICPCLEATLDCAVRQKSYGGFRGSGSICSFLSSPGW